MSSLRQHYKEKVIPALEKKFNYQNELQVPNLKKVVVNVGVGQGLKDADYLTNVENTLKRITGQKPVRNLAKKSIAAFKIREGMIVGVSVTLRGEKMWSFIEKLVKITLPRVRDFRGVDAHGFDSHGNYSLGFREYLAFPEIRPDDVEKVHGLEIAINTSAHNKEEGQELLTLLGFPFKKD